MIHYRDGLFDDTKTFSLPEKKLEEFMNRESAAEILLIGTGDIDKWEEAANIGAQALRKLDKLQKMLDEGRRDGILNWAYYEIEEVINESS